MTTVGYIVRSALAAASCRLRLNILSLLVTGMVAMPVIVVLSFVFVPATDIWHHLASTVLPRYIVNTLWLVSGVSVATLITGVGTAWPVTICRFLDRQLSCSQPRSHAHDLDSRQFNDLAPLESW